MKNKIVLDERFWSKVEKTDTCWLWKRCAAGSYPQFTYDYTPEGADIYEKAHRLSWLVHFGGIPDDFNVVHKCLDKRCVRPEHLELAPKWKQTEKALEAQTRPSRERDMKRFMEKVTEVKSGCWLWRTAARQSAGGYGMFWLDGRTMGAHQASYVLFKGPLAPKLVVRHSCDDRECVCPEHLSLGTHADNMRDAVERHRHQRGSKHVFATLDEKTVATLKAEAIPGRFNEAARLATKYGTSIAAVRGILAGTSWKHVGVELGSKPSKDEPRRRADHGENHPKAKLTEKKVRAIKKLRRTGATLDAIAEKFGVTKQSIAGIVSGKTWTHVKDDKDKAA